MIPLPATNCSELDSVESLTLWDSGSDPIGDGGVVYRWNGHEDHDGVRSLLRYVDLHEERLRLRYLAWIHDLGERQIDGKRLIDHLAFEDGLSYWWMTLIAEKSPYKSPITDAIRLLALEEIIIQHRPAKFRLVSANRILNQVTRDLCLRLGIEYEWQQVSEPGRRRSLRSLYHMAPQPLQALVTLVRQVRYRWPLRRTEKSGWFGGDEAIFLCSYFLNVDPLAAEEGRFYSDYWGGLHELLGHLDCKSNWLHLLIPDGAAPSVTAALGWMERFNRQRQEQGFHAFVDGYLSWRVVLAALIRWITLVRISFRLRKIEQVFRPQDSHLSLWPLMKWDWYASLRGGVAIDNLMFIELFDRALADLPRQTRGVYLFENQPWERALVHSWRKHGHGQLIGAAVHVSVRFWDLRYFNDPRTVRSTALYPLPQPDLIALNGKAAMDAYLGMDYPKKALVECEALRHGSLNDLRTGKVAARSRVEPIKILILGDYMSASTINMLRLLEAAVPHASERLVCAMKPHPNFLINPEDYRSLDLRIVTDPLVEILHDFDIAYSSNMTSAALVAYLAGLPVVVTLDETELNFSPLRGRSNVRFVSTPEELARALQTSVQNGEANPDGSDFFFLDPELPRWKRLLSPAA